VPHSEHKSGCATAVMESTSFAIGSCVVLYCLIVFDLLLCNDVIQLTNSKPIFSVQYITHSSCCDVSVLALHILADRSQSFCENLQCTWSVMMKVLTLIIQLTIQCSCCLLVSSAFLVLINAINARTSLC